MSNKQTRVVCLALVVATFASLGFANSASAKLSGVFTVFEQCPWDRAETFKCLHSVTEGGEVVLGNKKVPILNPVTLQGGYTLPSKTTTFGKLIAAKDGITLSEATQPIPGGLMGIVPPQGSSALIKAAIAFVFENGLTGVNATLELARPANEVLVSELRLGERRGVALRMPVKVRLENPFLGSSCYVGSSSSPIVLVLTSGITTPPPPNKSIEGSGGAFEFLKGGQALHLNDAVLVDNSFSAPKATGCGGSFSFLVDPIINAELGDTTAGHNSATFESTITITSGETVKRNDDENP